MEKITKRSDGIHDSDVVRAVQEVIGTWLTGHGFKPVVITEILQYPAITSQGTRALEVVVSLEPLERYTAPQDAELDRSFNLGISAGLERAAVTLMKRAAEAYTVHNDEVAKALRQESESCVKLSQDVRNKQEESHE